jgi:RNA polymerase sigma factor (sigma-70 family)
MTEHEALAERFQAQRGRLQGVAYRMLGSLSEAEDAVQETWLRLQRADTSGVENLAAWLTTVVSRVCLDLLRSRAARREDLAGYQVPDGIQDPRPGGDPEQETVLADSVGRALLVVLDTLGPAERIAFVLHDMFVVPFDEIAPIVDRSPVTTKKLASRARQRVRGTPAVSSAELARSRRVVEAFLAASSAGDVDAVRSRGDRGLRAERQVRGPRVGQRRGGPRGGAAGTAEASAHVHGRGRADRRVRAHRRPRPAAAARPGRPRHVTGGGRPSRRYVTIRP